MSERLLSAGDLGALAPYDNGSYVCECPGDYCLVGDCLGKVETLSTVVESIVRREVARALERAADDCHDDLAAIYLQERADSVRAGGQS